MNIGIIVFPSNRRDNTEIFGEAEQIATACRGKGHTAKVLNSLCFSFLFDNTGTKLFYNNEHFPEFDIIIAWVGMLTDIDERISALKEIEIKKVPVLNNTKAVLRTRDKFRTLQILSKHNIPTIKTVKIADKSQLDFAIGQIGKFPIVTKTIFGNDGKGVAIFESERSLYSGVDLMLENNLPVDFLLLQEFVECDNRDYRVFVVGDEAIAEMERSASGNDFRANLSSGGYGKGVQLPNEVKELAISASKSLDLDIVGVDILLSKSGPIICEVNPRPGFKIGEITNTDIAGKIVELAEKRVKQNL